MGIDLHPTICNLCGGGVIFTSNSIIYGIEYGSGRCYYCMECGSYVGTHVPRPDEAMGILANRSMRTMKNICHELFDEEWLKEPTVTSRRRARNRLYEEMAAVLGIPKEECHFGYFDLDMLNNAYEWLKSRRKGP